MIAIHLQAMKKNAQHLARIDLRALGPTPDGLLEILRRVADIGYDGFSLLYEDRFPWTVDERMRSESSYPDDVVAGIAEWCERKGLIHAIELSAYGLTDTLLSIDSFGYLRSLIQNSADVDRYGSAARRMIERVLDDVYALVPQTHVVFSPSSLLAVPEPLSVLERHLESICADMAESSVYWGVGDCHGSDGDWHSVRQILPEAGCSPPIEIDIVCYQSCACYGGHSLRPLFAMERDFAASLEERTGRALAVRPDDLTRAFVDFLQAERDAGAALESAERTVAAAGLIHAGYRIGAALQADRAVSACRQKIDRVRGSGKLLHDAADRVLLPREVGRFIAERVTPIGERHALLRARVDALLETFVGSGDAPE